MKTWAKILIGVAATGIVAAGSFIVGVVGTLNCVADSLDMSVEDVAEAVKNKKDASKK